MRTGIFFILVYLLSAFFSFSQNSVDFVRKNFNSEEDYQIALRYRKNGDDFFNSGKLHYSDALKNYMGALAMIPRNADLNYKIGLCILLGSAQKEEAVKYFETAYKLDSTVAGDIHYVLAKGLHSNARFEEAIPQYLMHLNTRSNDVKSKWKKKIDKSILECKSGIELIKKPLNVRIENMGTTVNSAQHDHSPLISADESRMVFTSRREGSIGGLVYTDEKPYEDVYECFKKDGVWSKPVNLGAPLNTSGHDATIGISPDGQQLLIYRSTNRGDIYMSSLDGETWAEPVALSNAINTDYQETSASFSPDGQIIYFVSNRTDNNVGGKDIYMSIKGPTGHWSQALNLGAVVNTEYDEEGVFMHPDGKTLFFSSKGHNSLGGFDIFKTTRDSSGTWSTPVNIGYPINTPDNDLFFVLSASGETGYFSSFKADNIGGQDIYKVTFLNEKGDKAKLSGDEGQLTILKGKVVDPESGEPLDAAIEVYDNDKNMLVTIARTNKKTGEYLVSLPSGRNYGIVVNATGYIFNSENFNLPAGAGFHEVNQDISGAKAEVGSKIVLRNVFFGYNSAEILPTSFGELDRAASIIKTGRGLKVEIGGHSDNTGNADDNKRLSEKRAEAVAVYLISKGVPKENLAFKGHGHLKPIASNNSEEGRIKNRRVDFTIVGK